MTTSHFCECHFPPTRALEAVTKLAISPDSDHVARRFSLMLHAHHLPFEQHHRVVTVDVSDPRPLQTLISAMTDADLQSLKALPITSQGPQSFEVKPLRLWLQYLTTLWFPEAARHLVFHAQPIVRLSDGQVFGYEALVRARVRETAFGAGELLDAAIAHGQTRAFDALARTTAIRQIYPQLAPGQHLFINFAPGVIYNPDICLQTTFQACREVGADFSRLVFEITEGEAFPDLTLLRSILQRYRSEGAQVALDDLGSGHTSLSYLAELRPDIVKLDRALIREIGHSAPSRQLIRALTTYAHDLGSQVVAEGIEQVDELEAAQEAGVDFVQGYYLGRPSAPPQGVTPDALRYWNEARA